MPVPCTPSYTLSAVLTDPRILDLTRRYDECIRKREVDMGFNLFSLISEVYYRENLHSDIMWAILDPQGKHGHADLFLRLFLKFLREQHQVNVREADYTHATVHREQGRVDLLIRDPVTRKAIIIENKINGAGDMDRQLVRYHEKVTGDGYACHDIIYLCLSQKKPPDTHGWTHAEIEMIMPLTRIICAYDETDGDLLHGWLEPCIAATTPTLPETTHVLSQYRQLIVKLGKDVLNKPIMEEFYQLLLDESYLKSAVSLNAMLGQLSAFRVQRIMETFRNDLGPFTSTAICYGNDVVFQGFEYEGASLKIDIVADPHDATRVFFWNTSGIGGFTYLVEQVLQKTEFHDRFKFNGEKFECLFSFPGEEQALYEFIRSFKKAMMQMVSEDITRNPEP